MTVLRAVRARTPDVVARADADRDALRHDDAADSWTESPAPRSGPAGTRESGKIACRGARGPIV
ncbi:MAG TPA: hypothetical protein DCQ98_21670 [Planctomycetaceae bacterium]|nr:hypothetical protein [Planctomycetaceae bacterium]